MKQDRTRPDLILQSPKWRWERVKFLCDRNKKPTKYDDKYINDGYKYLRRYLHGSAGHYRLQREYPALWAAHQLHEESTGPRWLIEAGVVADKSPTELSLFLGCSDRIIDIYEAYFFDIRNALVYEGYMRSRVLLPIEQGKELDLGDYDLTWKTIAYFGGWDLLTEITSMRSWSQETEEKVFDMIKSGVSRKALLASNSSQMTMRDSRDIIEAYSMLTATNENVTAAIGGIDLVAMLSESKIRVLDRGISLPEYETRAEVLEIESEED